MQDKIPTTLQSVQLTFKDPRKHPFRSAGHHPVSSISSTTAFALGTSEVFHVFIISLLTVVIGSGRYHDVIYQIGLWSWFHFKKMA